MANTKYYLAETYKHHIYGDWPLKMLPDEFPICPMCKKDIYCDDLRKEWACSDPECYYS